MITHISVFILISGFYQCNQMSLLKPSMEYILFPSKSSIRSFPFDIFLHFPARVGASLDLTENLRIILEVLKYHL